MIWLVLASVLMFVGSIVVAWIVIVRMPTDYLTREGPPSPSGYFSRHPVVRLILKLTKNAFGLLFVIAGIVMLLTPGQGILFIFLGATMVDLPGKKQVISRLLQRPTVLKTINKIREKAHRPPIEVPQFAPMDATSRHIETTSSTDP